MLNVYDDVGQIKKDVPTGELQKEKELEKARDR